METTIQQFNDIRLQLRKDEVWRNVDFSSMLTDGLQLPSRQECVGSDYRCNIAALEALRLTLENGYCHFDPITTPEGVKICSLRQALEEGDDKALRYFGKAAAKQNPYLAFNESHYTDGLFVSIPDNVTLRQPLQLQSVAHAGHGLFLQTRHLVVVGRNSHATILNCDDSYDQFAAFGNNVVELCVDQDAYVEYYKMQNLNDATGLLNQTYAMLQQGSQLRSVVVTLNGGHVRNHTEIRMLGEHCSVQAHGLYLSDKDQNVDNYVYVEHACPNCISRELFKGIMDDSAHGTFNGHVLVQAGATKTEAYQSNKNILLTDKALVFTKPFLEIYNDDVKCSHGSTIGQLDEQALFYIRSRGISERTAKTLLLYAFCDEVLQQIESEPLRESLSDLVKKRLHGELTPCVDCALHCNTPCNGPEANFYIDPEKL